MLVLSKKTKIKSTLKTLKWCTVLTMHIFHLILNCHTLKQNTLSDMHAWIFFFFYSHRVIRTNDWAVVTSN